MSFVRHNFVKKETDPVNSRIIIKNFKWPSVIVSSQTWLSKTIQAKFKIQSSNGITFGFQIKWINRLIWGVTVAVREYFSTPLFFGKNGHFTCVYCICLSPEL